MSATVTGLRQLLLQRLNIMFSL